MAVHNATVVNLVVDVFYSLMHRSSLMQIYIYIFNQKAFKQTNEVLFNHKKNIECNKKPHKVGNS